MSIHTLGPVSAWEVQSLGFFFVIFVFLFAFWSFDISSLYILGIISDMSRDSTTNHQGFGNESNFFDLDGRWFAPAFHGYGYNFHRTDPPPFTIQRFIGPKPKTSVKIDEQNELSSKIQSLFWGWKITTFFGEGFLVAIFVRGIWIPKKYLLWMIQTLLHKKGTIDRLNYVLITATGSNHIV